MLQLSAVQAAPNHNEPAGAWLIRWPLAAGGAFEDHVDSCAQRGKEQLRTRGRGLVRSGAWCERGAGWCRRGHGIGHAWRAVEDKLAIVAAHREYAFDAEYVLAPPLQQLAHPSVEEVELELLRCETHTLHPQRMRQEGGRRRGGSTYRRSLVSRLELLRRPPQLRQPLECGAALEGMLPQQLVQRSVGTAAGEDAGCGVDGSRRGSNGGLLVGGGEVNLVEQQQGRSGQ